MLEHIIYKGVKDFSDDQIKTIALRYANTPYDYSARAIAVEFSRDGEYTILPRTILKLNQKAIKKAIVSEETAIKIRNKAVHNSSLYDKKSGLRTKDFYNSLIAKRREYLANNKKTIKKKKNNVKANNSKILNEQMAKEELKNLENRLKTLNFHIEIFDENNEEGITLDHLLSKKSNLEIEIKKLKYYWNLKT